MRDIEEIRQVSVDHAAKIVGVSAATIRNWAKAGHLASSSSRPLTFSDKSVFDLKARVGSESFSRLKKRANKAGSASVFLPEEYADNSDLVLHIAEVVACVKEDKLNVEAVMFLAAMRILESNGEIGPLKGSKFFSIDMYPEWARQSVKAVMGEWKLSLADDLGFNQYQNVYGLFASNGADDYLGLLYQALSTEGDKSRQGSYFTPTKLVREALLEIEGTVASFLDPCCGTGKYLLLVAEKFRLNPENIFGFDSDRIAINLAKINLLLAYGGREFTPNIHCMDSLSELATGEMFCETNGLLGKIDVIATNPPWGAYKNAARKKLFSEKIRSGETFSLFLEKSIQLLKTGGQLSFILPESILKIKTHADIREVVLRETTIKSITMLGREFTGVFTPVIRLDLIKAPAPSNWFVSVEQNGKISHIRQDRFENNEGFTFDVSTESHEEAILSKLYAVKHATLLKNAEWALGIVTGDNQKYVLDAPQRGAEAVFRGSDIFPYAFGEAKSFIQFSPSVFQQVAPERFFRAPEKLGLFTGFIRKKSLITC